VLCILKINSYKRIITTLAPNDIWTYQSTPYAGLIYEYYLFMIYFIISKPKHDGWYLSA